MPRITDSSFEDDSNDGELLTEQVAVGDPEVSHATQKFPMKLGKF